MQANQHKPAINPHTKKPGTMTRMQVFIWPEEKARIFSEAKKPDHNGSASSVVRKLINKLK